MIKKSSDPILIVFILSFIWATQSWAFFPQKVDYPLNTEKPPQEHTRYVYDFPLLEFPVTTSQQELIEETFNQYIWLNPVLSSRGLARTFYSEIPGEGTNPSTIFLQMAQTQEGWPVLGSSARFTFKKYPNRVVLVNVEAQQFDNPTDYSYSHMTPLSNLDQIAKNKIAPMLNVNPSSVVISQQKNAYRFFYNSWHKAAIYTFKDSYYQLTIDIYTGKTLIEDIRRWATTGQALGRGLEAGVFRPDNVEELQILPLRYLRINNSKNPSDLIYSDDGGNYSVADGFLPTDLSATLQGKYTYVVNRGITGDLRVSPGTDFKILFNPTGLTEEPTSLVNAYYHINLIHDWLKLRIADFPLEDGLSFYSSFDQQIHVSVNINNSQENPDGINTLACNAMYGGRAISTFSAGTIYWDWAESVMTCGNAANDAILYHEYGHYIDDVIGGMQDSGLSEGWGDTLCAFVMGQPDIHNNFFIDPPTTIGIRTVDNDYQYPFSGIDEVHSLGQAWSGFCWHFRERLIEYYTKDIPLENIEARNQAQLAAIALTESLILKPLVSNARDIPQALMDLLLIADPDENPFDDFELRNIILEVCERHNIPLRSFVNIIEPLVGSNYALNDPPASLRAVVRIPDAQEVQFSIGKIVFTGLAFSPTRVHQWTPLSTRLEADSSEYISEFNPADYKPGIYAIRITALDGNGHHLSDFMTIKIRPQRLTNTLDQTEYNIHVDGSWVVWEDEDPTGLQSVKLTNPSMNEAPKEIFSTSESQGNLNPQIKYPWVVFTHVKKIDEAFETQIYSYNIETPTEPQLLFSFNKVLVSLALGHDVVFWTTINDASEGIWSLNLSDEMKTPVQLSTQVTDSLLENLGISDTQIVFNAKNRWSWAQNIYSLNYLETGARVIQITSDGKTKKGPWISGKNVVWLTQEKLTLPPPENWKYEYGLYHYDIETGIKKKILTFTDKISNFWEILQADVKDNRVVWSEEGNVYEYNLATKMQTVLMSEQTMDYIHYTDFLSPVVSGRSLACVFKDYIWGETGQEQIKNDVYYYDLPTFFIRGDANGDYEVNIADAIKILLYLFSGDSLACTKSADVNDDGNVDLTDAVYLLDYLFKSGPAPKTPYPSPGADPTDDGLSCP